MDKNLNYENISLSVRFFRNGKGIYYKFNGEIYRVNGRTINWLKAELKVPFRVKFYGVSRAQVGRILNSLLDNTIELITQEIKDEKSNALKIEAIFIKKKNYIEAYNDKNGTKPVQKTRKRFNK